MSGGGGWPDNPLGQAAKMAMEAATRAVTSKCPYCRGTGVREFECSDGQCLNPAHVTTAACTHPGTGPDVVLAVLPEIVAAVAEEFYAAGVASRNDLACESADLRDQLAQTAEELTAAREDAAHQFTQRCVETVRAEDASAVVAAAKALLAGNAYRYENLRSALADYDARSLLVDADSDGAGMRHLAAVLLAHADRLDVGAAPADLDVDERRAALLAAGGDALMAAHRATRVAPVDPEPPLGAEIGAQSQPEGDLR